MLLENLQHQIHQRLLWFPLNSRLLCRLNRHLLLHFTSSKWQQQQQ
jgi:hypothetical protein